MFTLITTYISIALHMFITTITGEKLSLKCHTQDQNVIKDELNKKYGYDIDKLKLYWNGNIFILGFFGEGEVCDVNLEENKEELNPCGSLDDTNSDIYRDKLVNDSKLSSEDKSIICKNLKSICKKALDSFGIDLNREL
ncbi:hypothetical protein NBO_86g0006 [Nosema bombycis CQ1]|uniref:Uncharacterized protein n=1 Tax=Nosema bombycis (strain CQ1 / CVCC 102059) TaxID=578461 RepID=R0KRA1_NOSB1|nr:hypothetical protein NBO_86g0006 [Nosema bombycis CQ1]|eukprot:EOB13271.1 hypothetical protein NBO_86g0006 [Nosema bombycis CQ1]